MKTVYTTIDPIPANIPRQLAIEILQNHGEVITVNPLVIDHRPIKAPADAPSDEYYSSWYEIEERMQFVPGVGKMGSGKISFRGCFHDQPYGVQTHMYVPFGVDLRHKYQIKGNQPGEPPEPRELGSDAPASGLYLRVDAQIKCNFTMLSFVKKEMKAASTAMVERMIKKAELVEAGVLHAMFEDGKLKTFNPADKMNAPPMSPPTGPYSPGQVGNDMRYRPGSTHSAMTSIHNRQSSLSASQSGREFGIAEMPGDYPTIMNNNHLQAPGSSRFSQYSEMSGSDRSPQTQNHWSSINSDNQSSTGSTHSRPTSYAHTEGVRSPDPTKTFVSELANTESQQPIRSPGLPSQQYQQQQMYSDGRRVSEPTSQQFQQPQQLGYDQSMRSPGFVPQQPQSQMSSDGKLQPMRSPSLQSQQYQQKYQQSNNQYQYNPQDFVTSNRQGGR